jgi:DNA-binding SARP family transcriptional activator
MGLKMADLFYNATINQLRSFKEDIRLHVVHPSYAGQHRILEDFLASPSTIYVRFVGHDLSAAQLDEQYQAAFATQMNGTSAPVAVIILDECDRAATHQLEFFLEKMLSAVSKVQIWLLTRSVPEYIYRNAGLRKQSRFIPADSSLMLVDYAQQSPDKMLLEVQSLGSGRVMLNGRLVDNWDGTLPRALFFYLVDRGMTTRSQIFDTFWPNLTTREATNVFHVTKRKISEVLGVDLTVYWSGFYHISADIQLSYDTVLFSEMLTDSAVLPIDEAIPLFSSAIALYQGDFLTSMDMPWVQKRRDELRMSYGEVLNSLAKAVEQQGEIEQALGLYVRASSTNRQREDIARSIMSLYAEMGMIDDAMATYNRLADELDQKLGVPPSKETEELIVKIRNDPTTA